MASSPYAQYSGQFVRNFLYIHKAKPPTHPETDAPKVPSFTRYLFPSPCITITPLLVCLSRNRNNAAFHATASSLSRFVRTRTFLLTYSPHKQMRIIAFQIYLQHALLNTPLSISVVFIIITAQPSPFDSILPASDDFMYLQQIILLALAVSLHCCSNSLCFALALFTATGNY